MHETTGTKFRPQKEPLTLFCIQKYIALICNTHSYQSFLKTVSNNFTENKNVLNG